MTEERRQKLLDMAEDYEIDERIVFMLADLLGENEDDDGLVVHLEDAQMMGL